MNRLPPGIAGQFNFMEIWKSIKGYEGHYSISNKGSVISFKKGGQDIKIKYKKSGYAFVGLFINGVAKYFHVHRLVAEAFIPNPENKPQVNHVNGVKNDNRVENLQWMTDSENKLHRYRILKQPNNNKLTKEIANKIRSEYIPRKNSTYKLAKVYSVSPSLISMVVLNKIYV